MNTEGGNEARSLLQRLAIWACHILLVVRMKFASLLANMRLGQGLLVYPLLSSWRSPNITGILLTGILKSKSINQSK